ncbi:MAG TPA: hypothetical protein VJR29_09910 [bacterium]|nr:hypothetical protein [bacterium]
MGDITLDFSAEGIFPFHLIDDSYHWGLRFTPRVNWQFTPTLSLHTSPTVQFGHENALTDAKLPLFRLNPDRRLLVHDTVNGNDLRVDIPEVYLKIHPSPNWQLRLGRYYWDNTIQRIMRDWINSEGFNNGNLADPQISVGPLGGDLRFRKPWTEKVPVDLKFSLAGGMGGRKEALGLLQGLATFSFLDKFDHPGWATSIGASLGYVHYPEGSLPALYPGVDPLAAGGALAPSVLLQQGLGEMFDLRVGYGYFAPVNSLDDPNLRPLKPRHALNTSLDYHNRYFGVEANYGRAWREDLFEYEGTKVEDQFGLSGRWMAMGDKNRGLVNFVLGGLLTRSDEKLGWAAYGAFEFGFQGLDPTKFQKALPATGAKPE